MQKQPTVFILITLLVLFCFRVAAQFIQSVTSVSWLPEFEIWHSGALPYPSLLAAQLLIVSIAVVVIFRIQNDTYRRSVLRSKVLLVLGFLYLAFMLVRFVLSVTILSEHFWFGATLPAIFHIVLACFIVVVGLYERGTAGIKNKL